MAQKQRGGERGTEGKERGDRDKKEGKRAEFRRGEKKESAETEKSGQILRRSKRCVIHLQSL